ncbi:hypothetical protein KAI12_01400 [Candidatus Bathyarchaeota archaeon]|nr:hypothetical protein [Candidatus Bathyarchaeota archaeon]
MFENNFGKLLLYAPSTPTPEHRLQSVRHATEKIAKLLNLDFEFIRFRERLSHIYVYYENGFDDPIPIYCDNGKKGGVQDVASTLRKMMFVLSFHPNNLALKEARAQLFRLS